MSIETVFVIKVILGILFVWTTPIFIIMAKENWIKKKYYSAVALFNTYIFLWISFSTMVFRI